MRRRRPRVVRNNATSAPTQTTEGPVEARSVKNALKHSKLKSVIAPYRCGACERSSHKTKPSHLKSIIIIYYYAYLEELVEGIFSITAWVNRIISLQLIFIILDSILKFDSSSVFKNLRVPQKDV